jgi:peroxin-5
LYFIKREYQPAVEHFQQTLNIDPTNYLIWNKFGAAIAHLGQNDVAQEAYFKALDHKPNYVRAWTNLAMAHGGNRDYKNSVNFY